MKRKETGYFDSYNEPIFIGDVVDILATNMYDGLVNVENDVVCLETVFFNKPLSEHLQALDIQNVKVRHVCEVEGCGSHETLKCDCDGDIEILCTTHAIEQGYCYGCGYFSSGQSGFDLYHPGLCSNCHSEFVENEMDDDEYDDLPW